MSRANFIIYAVLAGVLWCGEAKAAGLDEIYRDLVRSDNRGYLPLFVKNRKALQPADESGFDLPPVEVELDASQPEQEINFENERLRRKAEIEAANARWKQVLKNVQSGYVSSFELDELTQREQQGNPQAVEVLAWIYSRGVGVKPDFIKAFHFYKKAVNLNVPGAMDNAVKVYRAMSPAQKAELGR